VNYSSNGIINGSKLQ